MVSEEAGLEGLGAAGSEEPLDQDEPEGIAIGHDPDFRRVYADTSTTHFLGRDVELSFIAATPSLYRQNLLLTDGGQSVRPTTVTIVPGFVETARVRMNPGAAAAIGISILRELVANGALDASTIRENFEAAMAIVDEPKK